MVAFQRGAWGRRRHDQGHVGAGTEETWYARQSRDGSVLSCPPVIVHPLSSGVALLQPCAYRARLWRRDAGGGRSLSPVSGATTKRQAPAMAGAVCPVRCPGHHWGRSLLRPPWCCAGCLATAACCCDARGSRCLRHWSCQSWAPPGVMATTLRPKPRTPSLSGTLLATVPL